MLGPAYPRELGGPFRGVPLLPAGGIAPANAAGYVAAYAIAVDHVQR